MRRSITVGLSIVFLLLLSVPSFAFKTETHQAIVDASVDELYHDALRAWEKGDNERGEMLYQAAIFWDRYRNQLKEWVQKVDTQPTLYAPESWPVHHGYNSVTGKGWFGEVGCDIYAKIFEGEAMAEYRKDPTEASLAWKFFGAVLHFIQDEASPPHSTCLLALDLPEHARFERDAATITIVSGDRETKVGSLLVPGGRYCLPKLTEIELVNQPADEWIYFLATVSAPEMPNITIIGHDASQKNRAIGERMIMQAIRACCGYLLAVHQRLQQPQT